MQRLSVHGTDDHNGVLFFIDEFHKLGKMETFASTIPYFRGYKIRLFLIAQNLTQMNDRCGALYTDTIMLNSTFKVVLATNNEETAHTISVYQGLQSTEPMVSHYFLQERLWHFLWISRY